MARLLSGRVAARGPEKLLEKTFPPMLATLVDSPVGLDDHQLELKYDGYRALCGLSGGRVAMWTRNGLDLSARFPAIEQALRQIAIAEAVIDGEIAILDENGAPRFGLIQQRNRDARLFAFDLLWLDGEDLRARPLGERRDRLTSVIANAGPVIQLTERLTGTAESALAEAKKRGWEGVLAKRRGSLYENKRSRAWLKLKVQKGQELTIVGFTPSTKDKQEIGALQLAVAERGGGFRWAGKVGTGFTTRVRRELMSQLSKDKIDRAPCDGAPRTKNVTWVRPRLVAAVQFTEWTPDGKLRHPSFQGLRIDKKPEETVRE